MSDKLQSYRQPMVTAIGIILGFVLGFAADWATESTYETSQSDMIIVVTLCAGSLFLLLALYRILKLSHDGENPENYYRKTLKIFIAGLSVSLVGIFTSLILSML